VVDTALTGLRLGAQHMLVVSAMGANPHSMFFYNRERRNGRGDCAAVDASDDFAPVDAAGRSREKRANEAVLAPLFRLLPGNWKSIHAHDVAQAMLSEALTPGREGVTILPSAKLREIAASEA
jgi:uncharacterized protein YbjT (DUF2867 family)